jgi:hypothetical protein
MIEVDNRVKYDSCVRHVRKVVCIKSFFGVHSDVLRCFMENEKDSESKWAQ